jgi:2-octaprenyl-6-methoxyphenol hydroxylase
LYELQQAFGWRLGHYPCREAQRLSAFADHRVAVGLPSLALVGNAAQTLHPIAGQGLTSACAMS